MCLVRYTSLFTLVMLLIFEGTVVITRMRNHKLLREIMGNPGDVRVYRGGEWVRIKSDGLLPGDLISLARDKMDPDAVVPCDVVLLNGSVVTNEAILTGESTPQQASNLLLVSCALSVPCSFRVEGLGSPASALEPHNLLDVLCPTGAGLTCLHACVCDTGRDGQQCTPTSKPET